MMEPVGRRPPRRPLPALSSVQAKKPSKGKDGALYSFTISVRAQKSRQEAKGEMGEAEQTVTRSDDAVIEPSLRSDRGSNHMSQNKPGEQELPSAHRCSPPGEAVEKASRSSWPCPRAGGGGLPVVPPSSPAP